MTRQRRKKYIRYASILFVLQKNILATKRTFYFTAQKERQVFWFLEKKREENIPKLSFIFFWQTRSHCFFMHSKHRFWIEKYMFSIPFKPSLGCIDSERKERRIFVNNLNVLNISLKVRLRPLPFWRLCVWRHYIFLHPWCDWSNEEPSDSGINFFCRGTFFVNIYSRPWSHLHHNLCMMFLNKFLWQCSHPWRFYDSTPHTHIPFSWCCHMLNTQTDKQFIRDGTT